MPSNYADLLVQNTPFSANELEKKLRAGFQPPNEIYTQILSQHEAHWENLQEFIKINIGNTSVHRDGTQTLTPNGVVYLPFGQKYVAPPSPAEVEVTFIGENEVVVEEELNDDE